MFSFLPRSGITAKLFSNMMAPFTAWRVVYSGSGFLYATNICLTILVGMQW